MKQKKTYRFRLDPTERQAALIHQHFGCVRFVYNYFLSEQKKKDAYWYIVHEMVQNGQLLQNNWKGKYFNKHQSIKTLPLLKKKQFPFLKEVDSIALQASVEHLHNAYTKYDQKQANQPRFKSKKILFNRTQRNM